MNQVEQTSDKHVEIDSSLSHALGEEPGVQTLGYYGLALCGLIEGIQILLEGQQLEAQLPHLFYGKTLFDTLVKNQFGLPQNVKIPLDSLCSLAVQMFHQGVSAVPTAPMATPNVLQVLEAAGDHCIPSFASVQEDFKVLDVVKLEISQNALNLAIFTMLFGMTKSQTFGLSSQKFIWGCLEHLSCLKKWGLSSGAYCHLEQQSLIQSKQIFQVVVMEALQLSTSSTL